MRNSMSQLKPAIHNEISKDLFLFTVFGSDLNSGDCVSGFIEEETDDSGLLDDVDVLCLFFEFVSEQPLYQCSAGRESNFW